MVKITELSSDEEITELLSDEEIKKIAALLEVNPDTLHKLKLDEVKNKLIRQQQILQKNENQVEKLNEVGTVIDRLKSLEENWKNSFNDTHHSTNGYPEEKTNGSENTFNTTSHADHYYSVGILNCIPSFLELAGDKETQKLTQLQLEASYEKITRRKAETTTYYNADELPDNLKDILSNKTFPLNITYFQFTDAKQFQEFHNQVIAPLKAEGKITELTKEPTPDVTQQTTTLTMRR